jgi:geranylgeranyl diphosphate synthase type I
MSGLRGVESALDRRREPINRALLDAVPVTKPERLHGAARYLLEAGGKRLRPAILLLSSEALAALDPDASVDYRQFPAIDGGSVDVMAAATSVELVQTFTLVHDDLIDDDDVRRGVPAVHREYDDSTAILAGDVLHAKAFELLLGTGAPPERSMRSLARLARTCTEICEGQTADIRLEEREHVSVEEYVDMVDRKTAALFATSACLPAILLGQDDAVDPLSGYGREVGRAFQIHDDLLDLTTPTERLGKQRGSDLVEGKRTLVTVHARQQGVDVDGLLDGETAASVSDAEIDDAVDVLDEAGSLEFARARAREFVERGKDHLDALPHSESRRLLADTADYLVEREY